MVAATVFNQLISTLRLNPKLVGYIKYVYEGVRYNMEPDSMPCIMVEIRGNNEVEIDMNQIKKIWLDVDIIATVASPADPVYAIVGNTSLGYWGVLDVENDIRACLQSSYTLGNNVELITFDPTEFQDFEVRNVLVRGLRIPVRILYRQTGGI